MSFSTIHELEDNLSSPSANSQRQLLLAPPNPQPRPYHLLISTRALAQPLALHHLPFLNLTNLHSTPNLGAPTFRGVLVSFLKYKNDHFSQHTSPCDSTFNFIICPLKEHLGP